MKLSSGYGIHHIWEEFTMAQGRSNRGKSSHRTEVPSGRAGFW